MGYETGYNIGLFLGSLIWSLVWGFATAAVRERRGYGRRWFWFGFFLGLVPFIIACCIPAKPEGSHDQEMRLQAEHYRTDNTRGWQCSCGRTNATYVSTCTCGLSKRQLDSSTEQEN